MGLQAARHILTDKRNDLETLAKGLLEYETLTGDEIKDLFEGKKPVRESDDQTPPPKASIVPTTGWGKPSSEPDAGGLEPQPQA
jgi:cell division protease FtsH